MILLVAGFTIELMIGFVLMAGDYFRPSIIVSAVMSLTSVCALYLSFIWGFELSGMTIRLLLGSVAVVIVMDFISTIIYRPIHRSKRMDLEIIKVNDIVWYGVIVFDVITLIWHFQYLSSLIRADSVSMMVTQFRRSHVYGSLTSVMPSLLSRFIRIDKLFAYIFTYIFINNTLTIKRVRPQMKYLIPVFLYFVESLLWGARGYIIYVIVAGMCYVYFLFCRSAGWRIRSRYKMLKKIMSIAVGAVAIFIALGDLVGKNRSFNLFYRFSTYFGAGIPLLDDYLKKDATRSVIPGAATFYNMFNVLSRRFGIKISTAYDQFEFRYLNGYSMGNVYTALRRYYMDFGIVGVIILSAILSLIFGLLYTSIQRSYKNTRIDIKILVYGIMSRSLFLFSIDDRLFLDFASLSTIIYFIELLLCVLLVTSLKITKTGIRVAVRCSK